MFLASIKGCAFVPPRGPLYNGPALDLCEHPADSGGGPFLIKTVIRWNMRGYEDGLLFRLAAHTRWDIYECRQYATCICEGFAVKLYAAG